LRAARVVSWQPRKRAVAPRRVESTTAGREGNPSTLQCFWYPRGSAVLATFRVPRNSLMSTVTRLAERLLATDDVAEAQAIAKELRAAVQTRIEHLREKAHLMSYLIAPPSKNASGAT